MQPLMNRRPAARFNSYFLRWHGLKQRVGNHRQNADAMELMRKRNGWEIMGLSGVEPLTSSLSATRSNQLSYKPLLLHPSYE